MGREPGDHQRRVPPHRRRQARLGLQPEGGGYRARRRGIRACTDERRRMVGGRHGQSRRWPVGAVALRHPFRQRLDRACRQRRRCTGLARDSSDRHREPDAARHAEALLAEIPGWRCPQMGHDECPWRTGAWRQGVDLACARRACAHRGRRRACAGLDQRRSRPRRHGRHLYRKDAAGRRPVPPI